MATGWTVRKAPAAGFPADAMLPQEAPTERVKSPVRLAPVADGRAAALSVYPDLEITSNYREPTHPLSLKNPTSYHTKSHGAIDARPRTDMTFDQYVQGYVDRGYSVIEAKNEVGKGRTKHATGDHWHIVLGGGPADEAPAAAPADLSGWKVKKAAPAAAPAVDPLIEGVRATGTVGEPSGPAAPPGVETGSASAVVVPVEMQAPPTEEELQAPALQIAQQKGDLGLFTYSLARLRGLDDAQARAAAETASGAEMAAIEEGNKGLSYGERKVKDAKGRLATVVQSATLGFGDNLVRPFAPETADDIEAQRADYAKENPLSALGLSLVGGAGPAAGLNASLRAAGATRIPGVGSAGRALGNFETAAGLGPKLRNALRIGGQGAILGGADAAGNDTSVLTGALVGGAAGTLLGPASEQVLRGARAMLTSKAGSAIRALSGRLGESATALARRWTHFEAVTGRPPSIAEIADPALAQELNKLGKTRKSADVVLTKAADEASAGRPREVGDLIDAGGPTSGGAEAVREQAALDDFMNRTMKPIRGEPVTIAEADVRRMIDGNRAVRDAREANPQLEGIITTLEQRLIADGGNFDIGRLEAFRKVLGDAAATADGASGAALRHLRDGVERLGRDASPNYAAALDTYEAGANRIAGIKAGNAGRGLDAPTDTLEARAMATPAGTEGVRAGLRGRLSDDARETEKGAVKVARELAENTGTAETLRGTLGADEAKRLRRIGKVEATAADRLETASRGSALTDRMSVQETAAQIAETAALAGSSSSLHYAVRQGVKLLRALSMSSDKARRIAMLATMPGRSRQTIDALIAEGLSERAIRDFFNAYGASFGVAVNEATTRKRRERQK